MLHFYCYLKQRVDFLGEFFDNLHKVSQNPADSLPMIVYGREIQKKLTKIYIEISENLNIFKEFSNLNFIRKVQDNVQYFNRLETIPKTKMRLFSQNFFCHFEYSNLFHSTPKRAPKKH